MLVPLAAAQSAVTHEEQVVRDTYAKVDFLTQVKVISDIGQEAYNHARTIDPGAVRARLETAEVTFDLSDFEVGPISQAENRKWGELVDLPPLPPAQKIQMDMSGVHLQDSDLEPAQWNFATASWVPAKDEGAEATASVASQTFKKVLSMGGKMIATPDVIWSRYAQFKVTAHFQGQSLGPYRAVFLFGTNANGEEVVGAEDSVFDAQALFFVPDQPTYPYGLLRTRLRETPAVADFLDRHQVYSPSCADGKDQVCCVDGRCGLTETDIRRELETRLRHHRTL